MRQLQYDNTKEMPKRESHSLLKKSRCISQIQYDNTKELPKRASIPSVKWPDEYRQYNALMIQKRHRQGLGYKRMPEEKALSFNKSASLQLLTTIEKVIVSQ